MQRKVYWWEQRWIAATLGIAGGLFSLVSSCIGYSLEEARNQRVGNRLSDSVFSPDSKTLYGCVYHDVMGEEHTTFVAWDTQTGKRLWESSQKADGHAALYFKNDTLITVNEGRLHALSAKTGKERWKVAIPFLHAYSHVELSPEGKWVYVGSYTDLQVYSASTGKLYRGLDPRLNTHFAVRSDGLLVLQEERGERTVLAVVDPKTDKTVQGLAWDVKAWALSPDGTRLVVHTKEHLSLLDAQTRKRLAQTEIGDSSFELRFLPDGKRIHVTGLEWIWNPLTNKMRPGNPGELDALDQCSPDQKLTLTIETEGGKGRRFPLGYFISKTGKIPLEGKTGWDPTSAGK